MSHKCIAIEKFNTHLKMWYIFGINNITKIKYSPHIPSLVITNCTISQEAVQSIQVHH